MTRRRFEEVAVGQQVDEIRHVVTREDVRAYAQASGDHNPLHQDDAFARTVGFDGIIAHGMFTMGHMAAAIAEWAGNAEAFVRVSAGFRAPVSMGEELIIGGRIRALDPQTRTATLETWVAVERDGHREWPVKKGEAILRLA